MLTLKQQLYGYFAPKDCAHAIAKVRRWEYILPSQASRFAVPFAFRGRRYFRSIKPLQTPGEIQGAFELCCQIKPQRVLEIGTAKGGTLYLWCQAAADDATLISIDLPGGKFGGGYVQPRAELYRSFAKPNQTLHLLRANSHADDTRAKIDDLLDGQPFDFAFIDGDHSYAGVRDDFMYYGKLIRPGGVCLFHDINPAPHDPEIEVDQLWSQIKDRFESHEFIATDDQNRHLGIGMIRIGDDGFPADLQLQ
ncbi:MAG: class I SAM-dependent methyltransferase [Planctomycetota bacterium]